jgi:hypothetical protein
MNETTIKTGIWEDNIKMDVTKIKIRGAERVSASQEGLSSMESVLHGFQSPYSIG